MGMPQVRVEDRKQATSVDSLFPLVGPGSWTQVIRLDGRVFTHGLTELADLAGPYQFLLFSPFSGLYERGVLG